MRPDAIYTFFPFTAEGASAGFEALAFRSDADAIHHVGQLFREEPLAAEVLVCEADREVSREVRASTLRGLGEGRPRLRSPEERAPGRDPSRARPSAVL
jgi:hypothetical protein